MSAIIFKIIKISRNPSSFEEKQVRVKGHKFFFFACQLGAATRPQPIPFPTPGAKAGWVLRKLDFLLYGKIIFLLMTVLFSVLCVTTL